MCLGHVPKWLQFRGGAARRPAEPDPCITAVPGNAPVLAQALIEALARGSLEGGILACRKGAALPDSAATKGCGLFPALLLSRGKELSVP